MIEIAIDSEYIKLDQFLKLADIASTCGHAKFLIKEVETRRGKKIRPGDLIEVEGNSIMVV